MNITRLPTTITTDHQNFTNSINNKDNNNNVVGAADDMTSISAAAIYKHDLNISIKYLTPYSGNDLIGAVGVSGIATTTTNQTESDGRDEELAQFEILTLAIIFIVTLIGNGAVLLALYNRQKCTGRKKLSRIYFFILHLSIADLVTAFLNVLPQLAWEITYRFQGGPIVCKAVKFGQPLGTYLSSYILSATAIDRHQAICYPLTYCSWTSRRSQVMVWTAWIISLIFCVPQLFIFSYQEVSPGIWDCWGTFPEQWGEKTYVTWYSISVFIIPLSILVFTYTRICCEIWRNANIGMPLRAMSSPPCSPKRRAPLISRAKINTVKQTVAVIILYIASSSPFICAQLWATWDPYAYKSPFWTGATFTILTLLSSLNSCVNPWIYLSFNKELRKLLKHIICSKTYNNKNYSTAITNSGGSNSSQGVESTTVRVPLRISFYTRTDGGANGKQTYTTNYHPSVRYTPKKWTVAIEEYPP